MGTSADINALRQAMAVHDPFDAEPSKDRFSLGLPQVDRSLGGGLHRGALHEIIPGGGGPDRPAAVGFIAGLCQRAGMSFSGAGLKRQREIVWLRQAYGEAESGKLYPPGLREMGLKPEGLVLLRLKSATAMLRAAAEAADCAGLGAVVVDIEGHPAELDLTATRKLSLAAERSGVPILCLRSLPKRGSSAAMTRWQVRPTLSRNLEANAPGNPAFALSLSRHRKGRDGLTWRLEWNRDELCFAEAPLSGSVVSLSTHRSPAPIGAEARRRSG